MQNVIKFRDLPDDEKKRRSVAISNVFKVTMLVEVLGVGSISHFLAICPSSSSVRCGRATMPKTDAY